MLAPSILPSIVFLILTPAAISIRSLDAYNASVLLERFFALAGIIVLTPLPLPEQDKNIRKTTASRYTPLTGIIILRFILLFPLLPILTFCICGAMVWAGSVFPFMLWALGSSVSAFMLGTLGFFSFVLTGNWVAGYLAPVFYYVLNMAMGTKLGKFNLFSLGLNSFEEKYWLMASGLLLVLITFVIYQIKLRKCTA